MLQTQAQPKHHAGFNDENMASVMQSPASKKRKRPSADNASVENTINKRPSLTQTNGNSDHINGTTETYSEPTNDFTHINSGNQEEDGISSTAHAALTAHLTASDTQNLAFGASSSASERQLDDSFNMGDSTAQTQDSPYGLSQFDSNSMTQSARDAAMNGLKPAVGTDEWHKVRRDNHKEVERRRRETINEGINELAKIVPGCEKNKGQILARAVTYINELKQREDSAGEKKVLEKVVLEQAVQELVTRNDDLHAEIARLHKEMDYLKKSMPGQYDMGERRNSGSEHES